MFKILHSLTDSLEALRNMTLDVIQEFAADNVRYLELRTTPKDIPEKMTRKEYMNTVLEATMQVPVIPSHIFYFYLSTIILYCI